MEEIVPSPAQSVSSAAEPAADHRFPRWFTVSTIAAASALAGGLAAAWYYRKTLETLRHAEEAGHSTDFGISEGEPED